MSASPPRTQPGTASSRQSALREWLERAAKTQVPVFSATVRDVTSVVGSTNSSASDLAEAIGRDAALSAKLLKLANSPLFSQQGRSITTINTAVVLLGFDAVRDLAVSLSIIDKAVRSTVRGPLVDALLRAFHAAGQARTIALSQLDKTPEEVFLAGLLQRLGELVFWSSGTEEVERLLEQPAATVADPRVQTSVIGFTLRDLTAHLVQQWNLGTLLRDAISDDASDERSAGVRLAYRLAAAESAESWAPLTYSSLGDAPQLATLVKEHAELLQQASRKSFEQIQLQAEQATQIAKRFGVTTPPVHRESPALANDTPAHAATDPVRQLAILSEMTSAMQGPVTLNQLLRLAMRGIVEGAGFDRVAFALLTPDRANLRIKHRLGEFDQLPELLSLEAHPLLGSVLAQKQPLESATPIKLSGEHVWQGATCSVLQSVLAGGTPIGLFYADRYSSGPAISPEAITALGMFVQQIALGLAAPYQQS
ncbi:MAG: HDOD domain-containing protein [Pseudomonadota bacterium]